MSVIVLFRPLGDANWLLLAATSSAGPSFTYLNLCLPLVLADCTRRGMLPLSSADAGAAVFFQGLAVWGAAG